MSTLTPSLSSSVDHQRVWDSGYELLELVSSGAYCDVWRIRHRATYELYAWKQLRAEWESHPAARASLENDAAVGQLVVGPVMRRLISNHASESPRYVIWEWFEGESVEELWQKYGCIPDRLALWVVRQCAQGLNELLRVGLVHGDLRPEFILVDVRTGAVKLTEFGAARRISSAPDPLTRGIAAGPLADYSSVASPQWSGATRELRQLGLILFRSMTGRFPFEAQSAADLVRGPQTNVMGDLQRSRPDLTLPLAELLSDLLSTDPQRRNWRPSEVVDRLMELEVAELLKLGIPQRS